MYRKIIIIFNIIIINIIIIIIIIKLAYKLL